MSPNFVKAKILLVEEDPNLLDILKSLFRSLGCRVHTADDAEHASVFLQNDTADILVCDYSAWKAFQALRTQCPALPPVIVTATYGELELAQTALKQGANAILPQPVCAQSAINAIHGVLPLVGEQRARQSSLADAASHLPLPQLHFSSFVGESPEMQRLYDLISKAASTDLTVLIRGESGTGKDLAAKAIHESSRRNGHPFVTLNCSAVPENLLESELFGYVKGAFTGAFKSKDGLFKAADGGTIFLDEIGSVSISMQLSLLRVLQDKTIRPVGSNQSFTVDVRVVAATNENLEDRIRDGQFREDLFFRLNSFPVNIPALRERAEDIPTLAAFFLAQNEQAGRRLALSQDAVDAMKAYSWPGNVRELQNVIRRCTAIHDVPQNVIVAAELGLPEIVATPAGASATPDTFLTLKAYIRQCERAYLRQVLESTHGDKEKAAGILGISIGTFYRKIEE